MSYGTNLADLYRRAAVYVGKILKGARPPSFSGATHAVRSGDQSEDCRILGLTIPQSLLLQSDDVIQ